jgi:hypothetical protein
VELTRRRGQNFEIRIFIAPAARVQRFVGRRVERRQFRLLRSRASHHSFGGAAINNPEDDCDDRQKPTQKKHCNPWEHPSNKDPVEFVRSDEIRRIFGHLVMYGVFAPPTRWKRKYEKRQREGKQNLCWFPHVRTATSDA